MEKGTIEAIWNSITIDEYVNYKRMFDELRSIGSEPIFTNVLLYKVGVAEGKRQERARRRKAVTLA